MTASAHDLHSAVRDDRRLNAAEKHVAHALITRVRRHPSTGGWVAWPSVSRVALDCGVCDRTARIALRGLQAKGWLTVTQQTATELVGLCKSLGIERPPTPHEGVTSNLYTMHPLSKNERGSEGYPLSNSAAPPSHILPGTPSPRMGGPPSHILPPNISIDPSNRTSPGKEPPRGVGDGAQERAAYARGISKGKGSPYSFPTEPWVTGEFLTILGDHAVSDGEPLEGQALTDWIERKAEAFADFASTEDPKMWSSFGPKGFRRWLNEACPGEHAPAPYHKAWTAPAREELTPDELAAAKKAGEECLAAIASMGTTEGSRNVMRDLAAELEREHSLDAA